MWVKQAGPLIPQVPGRAMGGPGSALIGPSVQIGDGRETGGGEIGVGRGTGGSVSFGMAWL